MDVRRCPLRPPVRRVVEAAVGAPLRAPAADVGTGEGAYAASAAPVQAVAALWPAASVCGRGGRGSSGKTVDIVAVPRMIGII